jgi:hypothetical protein
METNLPIRKTTDSGRILREISHERLIAQKPRKISKVKFGLVTLALYLGLNWAHNIAFHNACFFHHTPFHASTTVHSTMEYYSPYSTQEDAVVSIFGVSFSSSDEHLSHPHYESEGEISDRVADTLKFIKAQYGARDIVIQSVTEEAAISINEFKVGESIDYNTELLGSVFGYLGRSDWVVYSGSTKELHEETQDLKGKITGELFDDFVNKSQESITIEEDSHNVRAEIDFTSFYESLEEYLSGPEGDRIYDLLNTEAREHLLHVAGEVNELGNHVVVLAESSNAFWLHNKLEELGVRHNVYLNKEGALDYRVKPKQEYMKNLLDSFNASVLINSE